MAWKNLFLLLICIAPLFNAHTKQHSTSIEKAAELTSDSQCFFLPPQGWDIADPKTLSPHVKIAFVKNTNKGFCPSINLAIEETHVSLSEYLKAVKAIHEQDRSNHWRALGKVRTAAGLAQLTEIDSTTEWGPIRLLQLILIKEGKAYVLTAAALKEDFPGYYKQIQSTFRSLTLSSDLLSHIPQLERKEALKEKQLELIEAARHFLKNEPLEATEETAAANSKNPLKDPLFQEKYWLPFQQTVLNDFGDMGSFWQILLLKNAQSALEAIKSEAIAVCDEKADLPSQTEENLIEKGEELENR